MTTRIIPTTLSQLFLGATSKFAKKEMSFYANGTSAFTYESFRYKVQDLDKLLLKAGVGAGDRVAVISENMPTWTAAFFAATAFGRVVVPVLPDCSATEINNILRHSEAKAVFASKPQLAKISDEIKDSLNAIFEIKNLTTEKFIEQETPAEPAPVTQPADLAAILYTSGTSGKPKGVMLSHRNLSFMTDAAYYCQSAKNGDTWMSILPMAHTFELAFGVLYPISLGARVCYLGAPPTPAVLLPALKKVRPHIMCSVPLIIEKIYHASVLKTIKKSKFLSWMQKKMPTLLYRFVGMKLKKAFGGRLRCIPIGGAKLDGEVENFLIKAKFPYAIGYGMTETSPLLCAAMKGKTRVGCTGPAIKGVTLKIVNPNADGLGEIVAKGPNVMMGYYKEPELTDEAFTEDGFLHTKDLATVDKKGRYYIKGRLGNMILGTSGENIYPEDIENVLNNLEQVEESIVKSEDGKLVAMVKLYDSVIDWNFEGEEELYTKIEALQKSIMASVNTVVNKASRITDIQFVKEPFEKTATRKIKRFLYLKKKDDAVSADSSSVKPDEQDGGDQAQS